MAMDESPPPPPPAPPQQSSRRSEILKGLPVRVENWLKRLFSLKIIASTLFGGSLLAILNGVIEGESFALWKNSIRPWFNTEYPDWPVSNLFIAVFLAFMFIAVIGVVSSVLIYGADRRRLGQLETVGQENVVYKKKVEELTRTLGQLETENKHYLELETEVERLRKQTRLLDIINQVDNELHILLQDGHFGEGECDNFVYSILRRTKTLFEKHTRISVYAPDESDPDYLTIQWDIGVGGDSVRVNRWYIGEFDPSASNNGRPRGTPGGVWVKGESRVNTDITQDPDYYDIYQELKPARTMPYKFTIHSIVWPEENGRKFAVLVVDSLDYEFTQHDMQLVNQLAFRLGWFMHAKSLSLNIGR
jgi:hypothetical protein